MSLPSTPPAHLRGRRISLAQWQDALPSESAAVSGHLSEQSQDELQEEPQEYDEGCSSDNWEKLYEGFIILTVLRAEHLKTFQLFGKPRFYCEAVLKYCSDDADKSQMDQIRRTKESSATDLSPEWNEKLSFHYCAGFEPRFRITISRSSKGSEGRAVGRAIIPLATTIKKGEERLFLPVLSSKPSGFLDHLYRRELQVAMADPRTRSNAPYHEESTANTGTWVSPQDGQRGGNFPLDIASLLEQDTDEVAEPMWEAQVIRKMGSNSIRYPALSPGVNKPQSNSFSYFRE